MKTIVKKAAILITTLALGACAGYDVRVSAEAPQGKVGYSSKTKEIAIEVQK